MVCVRCSKYCLDAGMQGYIQLGICNGNCHRNTRKACMCRPTARSDTWLRVIILSRQKINFNFPAIEGQSLNRRHEGLEHRAGTQLKAGQLLQSSMLRAELYSEVLAPARTDA